MNRRLIFLSGHLSGLLIGAMLVWTYVSCAPAKNFSFYTMPRNPVVIPVSYPHVQQGPNFEPLPEGWKLRHFNGQPYYIIPVEHVESGKAV